MTRPASATPWPGRGRRARGRSILSSTRSRRSGDLGFLIPRRACEREARGAAGRLWGLRRRTYSAYLSNVSSNGPEECAGGDGHLGYELRSDQSMVELGPTHCRNGHLLRGGAGISWDVAHRVYDCWTCGDKLRYCSCRV